MTDVQTLSHNIIPPESTSRCVVWTWGARAGEQRGVLGGGWTEAVCGRGGGHGHQIPSGGVLAPASLRQRRYGALAARWHHTHTLHKSTQERKRIIPTCHWHQACELTRARGCIPSSLAATRSRCWGRHCCWDACQTRERSVSRWLVHCSVKHNHYRDTKKFSARSLFIDLTIISKMNSGGGQGPFVMPQKADWDFA